MCKLTCRRHSLNGLQQKQSTLGIITRVQGSHLAPVIAQICPKTPKQGKKEEGGNERTDGDRDAKVLVALEQGIAFKKWNRKRGFRGSFYLLYSLLQS